MKKTTLSAIVRLNGCGSHHRAKKLMAVGDDKGHPQGLDSLRSAGSTDFWPEQ